MNSSNLVKLQGLIIKMRNVRDTGLFVYTLHNGKNELNFLSKDFFLIGESIEVFCMKKGKDLAAQKIEKIPDMYPKIEAKLMANIKFKKTWFFDSNLNTLKKIKNDFEKIAKKLFAANLLRRFIVVKFHNDADGISSALILKSFLNAQYLQQNSVVYTMQNGLGDVEKMSQEFKPLLVLLDFGTNEESIKGLELAKKAGIEIISIDHHPFNSDKPVFLELSLNPWKSKSIEDWDYSKYTTGFLCSVIAKMLGLKTKGFEKIACAGDRSGLLKLLRQDKEKALALDFAAVYYNNKKQLDFYSNILSKKEFYTSLVLEAQNKLEALDSALKKTISRKSTEKIEICWFSFDNFIREKEFPTRSNLIGRVLDIVSSTSSKKKPIVIIGYGKKLILLRLNEFAALNKIKANKILQCLRSGFSEFIENGGGHRCAAALRVKQGFEKILVKEIIKIIINKCYTTST